MWYKRISSSAIWLKSAIYSSVEVGTLTTLSSTTIISTGSSFLVVGFVLGSITTRSVLDVFLCFRELVFLLVPQLKTTKLITKSKISFLMNLIELSVIFYLLIWHSCLLFLVIHPYEWLKFLILPQNNPVLLNRKSQRAFFLYKPDLRGYDTFL